MQEPLFTVSAEEGLNGVWTFWVNPRESLIPREPKSQPVRWQAKDADDHVVCMGTVWLRPDSPEVRCFAPLIEYATPNQGATTLELLENGVWSAL